MSPGADPEADDPEIVYGISYVISSDGNAIFLPRAGAETLSRYCRAFLDAKTWGQVRGILEVAETEELYRQYHFAEDQYVLQDGEYVLDAEDHPVVHPPADDAAFDIHQVWDLMGGDWPIWPETSMYHWFPPDLAKRFGKVVMPMLTDAQLLIKANDIEELAARLERRGFRCVCDDALIASIVWE